MFDSLLSSINTLIKYYYIYYTAVFNIPELLHIRLTRPDGAKFEILSEASLEGRLPPLTWHHLAISVTDSVHSGKVIIEVRFKS